MHEHTSLRGRKLTLEAANVSRCKKSFSVREANFLCREADFL